MRRFLQLIGTIVFFCAWPAFWIYFRVGHGRTRVVVFYEGKVLVMKQWISSGKWGFPGGGLHKDEAAEDGAARELYEETHLRLDPRQLLPIGKAVYSKYGHSFEYQIFVAKVGSNKVRAQRVEVSELIWAYPEELTYENAAPDAIETLRMVREKGALLQ